MIRFEHWLDLAVGIWLWLSIAIKGVLLQI